MTLDGDARRSIESLRTRVRRPSVPADYDRTPKEAASRPPYRDGFWVRLTSEASGQGGYYSAKRLADDAETDADPAETWTDTAKEVNEREGLKTGAADGTVVWAWYDWTDSPAELRFSVASGLLDGTADYDILYWDNTDEEWKVLAFAGSDYQVLQRKADDTLGWDYVRAH